MKTIIRICALLSVLIPSALSAKKTETVINVIPYPQSVEIGKGTFKGAGANFNCDMAIDSKSIAMIRKFADEITFVSVGVYEMRRHLSCYFKGLPDFKETRMRLVTENDPDEVLRILDYIGEKWG